MKKIGILGSTGSIGRQTLEVIKSHSKKFELVFITANNNYELLIEQAKEFKPRYVIIQNDQHYYKLKLELSQLPITVLSGREAVKDVVQSEYDMLLTAVVGYSGLEPTIKAIKSGHNIALANKETLVVAGELVMELAHKNNVSIVPVDSEHSAIFQCLVGEKYSDIEKIYLTASGGPFRGMSIEQLKNVSVSEALKHPNWSMGSKITIDSATMMNKGLEAIEAKWLFSLEPSQIDIIIHPQSIIHSIVQFIDGSMKAQMGPPDMRLPIQYALSYPERIRSEFKRFNFLDYPNLSFQQPDFQVFKSLKLAYQALNKGGNYPCILNAANEEAVNAFLEQRIKFLDIPEIIESVMQQIDYKTDLTLEDYIFCDKESRKIAHKVINKR